MRTHRPRIPVTLDNGSATAPTVRLALGGAVLFRLQPLAVADLDWSRAQPVAFLAILIGLTLGCLLLLRSRRKEREEAESLRQRHARQVDELVHQQELRIREALERGAVRERDRTDKDLRDRLNAVVQAVREGFTHLEERLDKVDEHERERAETLGRRMEEAMIDLRRAGKTTVRIMLERFGLPGVLEDLRWALEAPGSMRVALQVQGIGPSLGRRDQVGIYHLVNDAVDAALGHEGVDRLAIRLERSAVGCLLSVENNGGEPLRDHRASTDGRRRLESRVTDMKGSISTAPLPLGGHTVQVEIPLGA
jgi:signal transduction histidine kinase